MEKSEKTVGAMESFKELYTNDSDTESDEVFFGPITKREIISKLRHYNLLNQDLLEPLKICSDNDALDDSLVEYYESIFPKRNNDDENWKSRVENFKSCRTEETVNLSATSEICEDSLEQVKQDSLIEICRTPCKNRQYGVHNQSTTETDKIANSVKDSEIDYYNLETVKSASSKELECSSIENSDPISENSIIDLKIDDSNLETDKSASTKELECSSVGNSDPIAENSIVDLRTNYSYLETDKSVSIKELEYSSIENSNIISIDSSSDNSDISLCSKKDNSSFNCTLEDMEMLLKYGENYIKNVDKSEIVDEKENISIYSNTKVEENSKKKQEFLSPTPKTPFRQASKVSKKSPNFKNIVSPIAMYIKGNPQVPLVQKVSVKSVQVGTFREIPARVDDFSGEVRSNSNLPMRSYRPATKTALLSQEEEVALPGSIRKLMQGSTPRVIKHLPRTHKVPEYCADVQEQHSHEDLTMLSNSSVEGDVSVHVSKTVSRTNHLIKH